MQSKFSGKHPASWPNSVNLWLVSIILIALLVAGSGPLQPAMASPAEQTSPIPATPTPTATRPIGVILSPTATATATALLVSPTATFVATPPAVSTVVPTPSAIPVSRTIQVSLTSDPDAVDPGDLITYTITITNNTTAPLANLIISDSLQPEVTFVPGSATGGV
ncbi:MAG: DUF11 domain-containing protein, partial [Chloroflexi bacterium]|nr:DUF11 domain-containing protein [Chloroflexota bacterium]